MATYIPYDSDPAIPAPYNFPGVTIQSFRLAADLVQQQVLVDKYLNIGDPVTRGFYYQACAPFVDMDFLYYPSMSYGLPPQSSFGSISQYELYFKLYVVKFVAVLDVFWLPEPAITGFFPYIFVDNSWSMTAGREVLGFPKLLASFAGSPPPPNQPLRPFPIEASTFGFNTIGPGATGQMLPFVKIDNLAPNAPVNIPVNKNWNLSPADIDLLDNPVVKAALASIVSADPMLPSPLRTVQLKQFRAAGSSTDACFQGIVEGQFSATNFNFFDPQFAQIQISNYVTLSIATSLGLSATTPIYPISQYAATCDIVFSEDETIYQYP